MEKQKVEEIFDEFYDNNEVLQHHGHNKLLELLNTENSKNDMTEEKLRETLTKLVQKLIIDEKNEQNKLANFSFDETYNPEKDCYFLIKANPEKGFLFDYILFIPKGTKNYTTLMMESSNSSHVSKSLEEGLLDAKNDAINNLTSNNSTYLSPSLSRTFNLPIIKPLMPRYSDENHNIHFFQIFDERVMKDNEPFAKDIIKQIVNIINDGKEKLSSFGVHAEEKVISVGHSATSRFGSRFTLLHPELVKCEIMGGTGGETPIPIDEYNGIKLPFPIGTYDIEKYIGRKPSFDEYKTIPKFYHLGKEEGAYHDTVFHSDVCSRHNAELWKQLTGYEQDSLKRFLNEQDIYDKIEIPIEYHIYEGCHREDVAINDAKIFLGKVLEKKKEYLL